MKIIFKGKWIGSIISCILCLVMLILCIFGAGELKEYIDIKEDEIPLTGLSGNVVNPSKADEIIMPDKYNTGTKGELYVAKIGDTIQGVAFKVGNNGTANYLDFKKINNQETVITFENIDFSNGSFMAMNEEVVERQLQINFVNCKFEHVATGKARGFVSYSFKDCTITRFRGSNSVFDACKFGGSYKDALVPYGNVVVKNSFFCDMASSDPAGSGVHTDGTQIYGEKGLNVTDVHYDNCRFEIPSMPGNVTGAKVNACIMLQLEYSDGENISFTNCTLNGGGYSLYAGNKNGHTYKNTKFENINIGCCRVYGLIHPNICDGVTLSNINNTKNLYIGSVWKANRKTYVSVTNDTNVDRVLKIFADGTVYEYEIPGSPNGSELYTDYEEYPFDIPICIEKDVEYLVCYDATYSSDIKQIRYVNWSNKQVVLSEANKTLIAGTNGNGKGGVLLQGSCGKNANFELTEDGVLTITGSGLTDDYHSQKRAPWYDEFRSRIREVIVGEGITSIGNQMFNDCAYIEKVTFPNTLETIGGRAFAKCGSLLDVELPASLKAIGDSAFVNVLLQHVIYMGTAEQWEAVEVHSRNANFTDKVEVNVEITEVPEAHKCVLSGFCGLKGNNIAFELDDSGILTLRGSGEMEHYHSKKTPPWYEYRDLISKIVVEEGIISIGAQAFRTCSNVASVELPNTIKIIHGNAFQRCKSLNNISIPNSVKEIRAYAFHNSALKEAYYVKGVNKWDNVLVYPSNNELIAGIKQVNIN